MSEEKMETIDGPPKMRAPKKKAKPKENEWKIRDVYVKAHVRGDISFSRANTDEDDHPKVVFEEFDSFEAAINHWNDFVEEHDSEIAERIAVFLYNDLLAWRCAVLGTELPDHLKPKPREESAG